MALTGMITCPPRSATAQGQNEPPLLFGGSANPKKRRPAPLDPQLPTGTPVVSLALRPNDGLAVCSFRRPVCVHPAAGIPGEATLEALAALETAWERLVLALDLPAPLPDSGRGRSDALDLYLSTGTAPLEVGWELVPGEFDRAAAFCRVGVTHGRLLARAATLCVSEAIALRLDAGETPHLRRAFATHLWWVVGQPTSVDLEVIDDVQAAPERAIATNALTPRSEGAALFLEWLDQAKGVGRPGALATGLFALAASHTPAGAWEFDDEPDFFDVLRHTLDDNRVRLAELEGSFAVARAFIGARDDGTHLPSLEWVGDAGRVRFDWSLPLSSLPRRVACSPIEPTGATYVFVELDGVPLGTSLYFRAEWEHPEPFKWAIVRLGADGSELGRVDVPFQENGTSAEQRVAQLETASALLIVGLNVGDVSASYPFDPDIAPFEPKRCTVFLAKQ